MTIEQKIAEKIKYLQIDDKIGYVERVLAKSGLLGEETKKAAEEMRYFLYEQRGVEDHSNYAKAIQVLKDNTLMSRAATLALIARDNCKAEAKQLERVMWGGVGTMKMLQKEAFTDVDMKIPKQGV